MAHLLDELDLWLTAHWDPALTVGEWWELLGTSGWAAPTLPDDKFGKAATLGEAEEIVARLAARSVLGPPGGAGITVVAPTIAAHGTAAQRDVLLRGIVTGRQAWCLLFSEPDAGSDLAALTTAAWRDGEEWQLDGRKTWATGAHLADMAIVLARSDPDSSRHHGLTCFALDMHQRDAVEVRPMREMTGRALSNDVVLTAARVPDAAVLGEPGNGWIVVNAALTAERHSVGGHRAPSAAPGSISGDLSLRAGDVVERARSPRTTAEAPSPPGQLVLELAAASGTVGGRVVRQSLARLHSLVEVARLTARRADDERAAGRELRGAQHIAKLWASEIARASRDVGLEMLGARALLHAYDRAGRQRIELDDGDPLATRVMAMALSAQAVSLVGGVDRLQRDLIGERVLGLPKGPVAEQRSPG
jgi:alkylation response protein AidB-like acyl-CoA dehydrogenase